MKEQNTFQSEKASDTSTTIDQKPSQKLTKALALLTLSLTSVLTKPELSSATPEPIGIDSSQESKQPKHPQGEIGFISTKTHLGSLIRLKQEENCYMSNYHVFKDGIKEFQLYLEKEKYKKGSSLQNINNLVLNSTMDKVKTFHNKVFDIAALETKPDSCNRKSIEKTFGKVPTFKQFTARMNDLQYKGRILTHRSMRDSAGFEQERKVFDFETTGMTAMISSNVQPMKISHVFLTSKTEDSENSVTYGASGSPVTISTKEGAIYGFYDAKFEKKDVQYKYTKIDDIYYMVVEPNYISDKYIMINGALFRAESFKDELLKKSQIYHIPTTKIATMKEILISKGLNLIGKNVQGFAPLVNEAVEELDQQSKQK